MSYYKSEPSLVYKYGTKAPYNKDLAFQEIWRKRYFYNDVVALERKRRNQSYEILKKYSPELVSIDKEIQKLESEKYNLENELNNKRKIARKRIDNPKLSEKIKLTQSLINDKYKDKKKITKKLYEDSNIKKELKILDKQIEKEEIKQKGELYWCNSNIVLADLKKRRKGKPPKYKKWGQTEGRLSIQLRTDTKRKIYGLDTQDIFNNNHKYINFIKVTNIQKKGKKIKATVWFRIGSDQKKAPVWITIPTIFHRSLPLGNIKWIHLVCKNIGGQIHWELHFQISNKKGFPKNTASSGFCAVDIGARKFPHGIRVAYYAKNEKEHGELILPNSIIQRFKKSESLRSIRDKKFNSMILELKTFFKNKKLPNIIKSNISHINNWRSTKQLHKLYNIWSKNRFNGDKETFLHLQKWSTKDKHLHLWETHNRKKAIEKRKQLYQNFGANLRNKFAVCMIENINLKDFQQKASIEDKETRPPISTFKLASISILRDCLQNSGMKILKENPAYTSQDCPKCGNRKKIDKKATTYTCERGCGTWDRDLVPCLNMLARAQV